MNLVWSERLRFANEIHERENQANMVLPFVYFVHFVGKSPVAKADRRMFDLMEFN